VFVVGCLGDGAAAAQVLFERESVCRDSAPRRAQGQGVAADADGCAGTVSSKWAKGTGGPAGDECYNLTTQVSATIAARFGNSRNNHEECVTQPVAFRKSRRAQSVNDHETWVEAEQANTLNQFDTGERDTHAVAMPVDLQNAQMGRDVAGTLDTTRPSRGGGQAVAFHPTQDPISSSESFRAIGTGNKAGCATAAVAQAMTVRRLTPRECERLQGFPDDWTMIPWRKKPAEDCPDGPRYKALGNSMAVNVMAWIGERIDNYERTRNAVRTEG